MLPRLCEAPSPANPARRRHRHSRQSRKPQVESCQADDPSCWRQALVPAAILARPQPDRTGLLQDQTLDETSSEAHHRRHLAPHRTPRPRHPASRMRQLLRQPRLCFRQNVKRARQRNGAYGWSIARDIADPELWTERYHCPTWFDYLRQRNRPTQSERALHQRAMDFHLGPDPVRVRRMLERPFGSVRWKEDTPDRAANEVLPVVATAAGSST